MATTSFSTKVMALIGRLLNPKLKPGDKPKRGGGGHGITPLKPYQFIKNPKYKSYLQKIFKETIFLSKTVLISCLFGIFATTIQHLILTFVFGIEIESCNDSCNTWIFGLTSLSTFCSIMLFKFMSKSKSKKVKKKLRNSKHIRRTIGIAAADKANNNYYSRQFSLQVKTSKDQANSTGSTPITSSNEEELSVYYVSDKCIEDSDFSEITSKKYH